MLDYTIHTIGVFTSPLRQAYTTHMPALCFFVTPPEHIQCDGLTVEIDGSCLELAPANIRFQVEHAASRRNWAAVIDSPDTLTQHFSAERY